MDLLDEALSSSELDELDDFLTSDVTSEWMASGSMLHGFFTALAVGPLWVAPSNWLKFIWGEKGPVFGSAEEAEHILGLVYRFYDSTRRVLAEMPEEFRPMLREGGMVDGEMSMSPQEWCLGFCHGLRLQNPKWKIEFMDKTSFPLVLPMLAFVFPEEMEEWLGPQAGRSHDEFLEGLFNVVPELYEYWRPRRRDWPVPATSDDFLLPPWAKGGGDAPCPCGSGKKCKECCGAPPT